MAAKGASGTTRAATTHKKHEHEFGLPPEPPIKTLRDVVVDEMTTNRHPDRPIFSRIVLVGEVMPNKEDYPPKQFFDELVRDVTTAVNADDPMCGKLSQLGSETVQIVGLYVEHEKTFFHLLESEPAHLLAFMCELERSLNPDNAKRYDGLKNVHVALAVDVATEGATKAFPRWCAVDAPLPSQPLPKTKPLEEQVADAVQAALGLGKVLKGQSASIMAQTLSSARTSHHQHLPKPNLVERLLACGCCLTLAEYVEVYAGVPAVVRPAEIVHPVEPSLNYEVAA